MDAIVENVLERVFTGLFFSVTKIVIANFYEPCNCQ